MAKTVKRGIGDTGEEVAAKYLINKGFVVLDRNYWKPWGEIDIVAKNADSLRFVEVKTVRRTSRAGEISRETIRPEENMHPAKIKRLYRAVQTYLLEKHIPESQNWQIDLICVFLNFETKRARVEILENITL